MNLHAIGIDLGKTVFHLVGLSQGGDVVVRKKFSRAQLLHFTANVQVDLIGMEACPGSQVLSQQGHEVRLMPAQDVMPFVKTNKNDFIDAAGPVYRLMPCTKQLNLLPVLRVGIFLPDAASWAKCHDPRQACEWQDREAH